MKENKNVDMQMDLQGHVFPVILCDSQEVLDRFTKWKYDEYTHKDNPKIEGDRIVSMTTFLQKTRSDHYYECFKKRLSNRKRCSGE